MAQPKAIANTPKRNKSLLPVRTTRFSDQGMNLFPATIITTTNKIIQKQVLAMRKATSENVMPSPWPDNKPDKAGINTNTNTMAMSSTINQPMAMRPRLESLMCQRSKAAINTTVLAQDKAKPNTKPAPQLQPMMEAKPIPSMVAKPICTIAPGSATLRTAIKSFMEKCRPTPNISKITPNSANCCDSSKLPCMPGMSGP